jgi:hypothetical protein
VHKVSQQKDAGWHNVPECFPWLTDLSDPQEKHKAAMKHKKAKIAERRRNYKMKKAARDAGPQLDLLPCSRQQICTNSTMNGCLWQLGILHSRHFGQPSVHHGYTGTEGGGGSGSDADGEAPVKPTKKAGKPAAVPAAVVPEPTTDISAWDVFGLHPGILRALAMQVCCSSYAATL